MFFPTLLSHAVQIFYAEHLHQFPDLPCRTSSSMWSSDLYHLKYKNNRALISHIVMQFSSPARILVLRSNWKFTRLCDTRIKTLFLPTSLSKFFLVMLDPYFLLVLLIWKFVPLSSVLTKLFILFASRMSPKLRQRQKKKTIKHIWLEK